MLNRFLNYLVSPNGRKFTTCSVAVASITMFGIKYLPNTVFVTNLREIVAGYKYGLEIKVPDRLHRRFQKALDISNCTPSEKEYLKPFIACGAELLVIGTISKFGGYIGIPMNYLYENVDDVDREKIRVNHNEVDWSSDNGKEYAKSMVYNENEQIFGIAKSILQIKTNKLLLTSLYPSICLMTMYTFGRYINRKKDMYVKPFPARLIIYILLSICGYGLYSFLTDSTLIYYDRAIDEKLSENGLDCINAGIGFYGKILQRNVSVRNLTGENTFTASGNINYLTRQKGLPLTARKSYFETRKSEYLKANSENSNVNIV